MPDLNELAPLAQQGDRTAYDQLFRIGYRLVGSRMKAHLRFLPAAYGDQSDLLQEGMIGLMEALQAWDPASGMQFAAFASVCIDRQLDQAVRMATRKKHAALNYGARLDKLIRRNGGGAFAHEITLMDVLPLPATDEAGRDPLEAVLAVAGTAEAQQLIDDLRDCGLSALEATVFDRCILHQVPYRTLAAELSVGAKTVDNAMQRIMRKVRARALELSLSDRYSPELRATLRQCGQTKRHRGGGKSPDEWIGDLAKGA